MRIPPKLRLPALAALVAIGALIGASLTIPKSSGISASSPRPQPARGDRARSFTGAAKLTEGEVKAWTPEAPVTGVLDLRVSGLSVPKGAFAHPTVFAKLTRVAATMLSTGPKWSASTQVIDGNAAFGEVPIDEHFELLLTDGEGDELLKTTILGPGHGLSPEYAAVRVSLGQ